MKIKKYFLDRRQFLIGAGVTSLSSIAFKKISENAGPSFQKKKSNLSKNFTGIAMASEKVREEKYKEKNNNYSHLLSPLKIRGKIIKNRMFQTVSVPHLLQGPENYPPDVIRTHYSNIAKNAAIVTVNMRTNSHLANGHWSQWDGENDAVHNYIDQMIEGIHCMGSLVSGGSVEGNTIDEIVTQAKKLEDKGYDVVYVGERYCENKECLAPIIEKMQAVRKSTSLIILGFILPVTKGVSRGPGGEETTGPYMEETVSMAKMLEGSADILQMKDRGHHTNHPNSFNMEKEKPIMLPFTKAIKDSGVKIITCPNGGFRDPASNEEFIASGKTDLIAMARPFISDPEYTRKAYEGLGEDWVPCVMCNKCHGLSYENGPWITVCSVNPELGASANLKSIDAPTISKRVAVIGGGPGGMKAAIVAAERGHKVTIYEKSEALGGQQKHTDFSQLKWAYKDFKDYLIRKVNKCGIEVRLKTMATPEMIQEKGYDTVLVAVGAEPIIPKIHGADGKNVYDIISVYTNIKSLGKNVVIIGGGDFGTETGICLAKEGYQVTALTSEEQMMERGGPHDKEIQLDMYQNMDNFKFLVKCTPTSISGRKVTYLDSNGNEKKLKSDSVVIYAGLKAKTDDAMKFSGTAKQVLFIGDCTGNAGNVQKTIRSAFFMASQT